VTLPDTRLKLAVFIDFDNIEIGVKSTLNTAFDIGTVLEALKERGEVVSKTAYSDWKRAGDYSRSLSQHAIKMVQRNLTPGGDKNGADINLALDALEMAFTHPHINAYVIVGGDSDFISLVEKLKQYDKKVMVVGGRSFTSAIMQRNCHEFIAYENLISSARPSRRTGTDRARAPRAAAHTTGIEQAIPLVERALEVLADREVSPQLGLLKSTLLQLDSTFSERSFGAGSFRDFAEKLEAAGLVTLKHSGRNILVELKDGGAERAEAQRGTETPRGPEAPRTPEPVRPAEASPVIDVEAEPVDATPASEAAPVPTGSIADVRRILARSKPQRFPMYIRNIKQLLRQTEPGFDERRYGFANIVDLLRALQREGMLRLERDRQGALRVFQGSAWSQVAAQPIEEPQAPSQPEDIFAEAAVPEAMPELSEEAADALALEIANRMDEAQSARPAAKGARKQTRKAKTSPTAGQPARRRSTRAPKAAKTAAPASRRAPRKPRERAAEKADDKGDSSTYE
jgi:uncharacterized LabA/DUF88 family protein